MLSLFYAGHIIFIPEVVQYWKIITERLYPPVASRATILLLPPIG